MRKDRESWIKTLIEKLFKNKPIKINMKNNHITQLQVELLGVKAIRNNNNSSKNNTKTMTLRLNKANIPRGEQRKRK